MVQTPKARLAAVLEDLAFSDNPRRLRSQGGSESMETSPSTLGTLDFPDKGESNSFSSSLTGSDANKRYKVWCYPADTDICLGIIGQGQTFCTIENCKKTHRSSTFHVAVPGEVFVLKKSDAAFVEPSLSGSLLNDDLLRSWMTLSNPLEEWNRLFSLVRLKADDNESGHVKFSEEDIRSKENEISSAIAFKTPRKSNSNLIKYVDDLIPEFDSFTIEETSESDLEKKPLLNMVRILDDRSIHLRSGLSQVLELSRNNNTTVISALESTDLKVNRLSQRLGSKPLVIDAKFDAPNLWLTVAQVIDEFSIFVTAQSTEILFLNTEIDRLAKSRRLINADIDLKLLPLEERIKSLDNVDAKLQPLEQRLDDLQEYSIKLGQHLKDKLDRIVNSQQTAPTMINTPQVQTVDLNERMSKLERELSSIRSATDETTIQYGGLGFRSQSDCSAWIETHQPHEQYGLIMDFNIVMEHVFGQFAGQKILPKLGSIFKMKLVSNNHAVAMTSFETRLPKFFMGESRAVGVVRSGDSYFRSIKTWEDWNTPNDGMRDQLKAEVQLFEVGHAEAINSALTPLSPFHTLCMKSLSDSCSWIHRLVKFIDDTYREYNRAHYDTRKAWHVTTKLAVALMEHVATPRNVVHNSFRISEPLAISQSIAYAIFRSLDLMTEILTLDFKNAPVITAELTKFLALNSNIEMVEKMKKKMDELTVEVGKSTKLAGAAEKAASTVGNTSDSNKKDIASLLKRVSKLENK